MNTKHLKRLTIAVLMVSIFLIAQPIYAEDFGASKYATGTAKLIKDIFFWLTVTIIPATAALMIAIQSWKIKAADGEGGPISEAKKQIKRILIFAVIGETASVLVTLITSYYV